MTDSTYGSIVSLFYGFLGNPMCNYATFFGARAEYSRQVDEAAATAYFVNLEAEFVHGIHQEVGDNK